MANSVRLLLVGSNGAVRKGLKLLLANEDGVEIVGQAENGPAAMELGHALEPNIVLIDLESLGDRALEVAAQVKQELSTKVAVLSLRDDAGVRSRAEQAGLHFVSKQADTERLLQLVRNQPAG